MILCWLIMSSSEESDIGEPPAKKVYKAFCNPKLKAGISSLTLRRQTQPKQVFL